MVKPGVGRLWRESLLPALVVLLALLAAGPAALSAGGVHWPLWLIAAIAAGAAVIAGVVKRVVDGLINDDRAIKKQAADATDRAAGSSSLPLVSEVTSRGVLGIHPAIPLPADADPSLSLELPTYVPRDMDADVHAAWAAPRFPDR
jgi:hypothetical protein